MQCNPDPETLYPKTSFEFCKIFFVAIYIGEKNLPARTSFQPAQQVRYLQPIASDKILQPDELWAWPFWMYASGNLEMWIPPAFFLWADGGYHALPFLGGKK